MIHGAVSAGVFTLVDIMDTSSTLGETSMRWLVYDTWISQAPNLAAHSPNVLNPTRQYMITVDITFRGRIRQRDNFGGFAMLEDARRVCAKVCWEGAKALRHYLVEDNLTGGRAYTSGRASSLWERYIDPPAEIIDQRRPCDDFFDLLRDPDPMSINRAQAIAVENNHRLTRLSSMSWNMHRRLQRIAPDKQIAIGSFVLENDPPSEVVWYVTHRAQDRNRPFSADLEITYQGEEWYLALGSGVTVGESCRLGAAFAWERAKMIRSELAKGTTVKEWPNLGNYLQALIIDEAMDATPEEIRNPAERSQRSKKLRAGARAPRIVAKIASELESPFPAGTVAGSPEQLVQIIDAYMSLANECYMGIFLDIRNNVIGYTEFSSGAVASVEVHPSGLFQAALLAGAAGIVTVHNHPSGNPSPSDDDFNIWARMADVGKLMGIPVVDNLVIVRGAKYYSEAQSGGRRPART
jgi:DNA repair protein RadC